MPSRTSPFAVWPGRDSPVSFRSYGTELAALARISLAPPPFSETPARGSGRPVVVVPGFCSPNISTARLRDFLLSRDFAAYAWECGLNIGPTGAVISGLESQLIRVAERHGVAPALIGQSLGGTIAREMAKRRPDLVSHVVTLVSPIRLPVATPLAPLAHCASFFWDGEARRLLPNIAQSPPMTVTAIVTKTDGLVDWRACVPDAAPNVEVVFVDGPHSTMGSHPEAQRIIAERLAA